MGSLSERLEARVNVVRRCAFGRLIDKHADADDQAWIDNPKVPSKAIAAEASAAWEKVSDTAVRSHRTRTCSCYRAGA